MSHRVVGAGDDLAGVHAHADDELYAQRRPQLFVQLADSVVHAQRGTNRAQGIVLVQNWNAEKPTTASPMNFSTVPPWDSTTLWRDSKIASQDVRQDLWIEPFSKARRLDEIGEGNADGLALHDHVSERNPLAALRSRHD